MSRYKKYTAGFLLFIVVTAVFMPAASIMRRHVAAVTVYADETSASEDSDGADAETDTSADPVLFVDGFTVYIDVETDGKWSSVEGTLSFDPSLEVADHGTVLDIVEAANDQDKLSMPVSNVTDEGEFIFAGIFTNIMDDTDGITYSGHVFFITFEETAEPITVTLEDSGGNAVEERIVDGEISDVVETEDGTASQGDEDVDAVDGSASAGNASSDGSASSDDNASSDGSASSGDASSDSSSEDSDSTSGDGSTVRKAGSSFHRLSVILRIVSAAAVVILVLVIVLLVVYYRKHRRNKQS